MVRARVVVCLLLAACAHTAPTPPRAQPPLPWYGDLHALAAEAAAVRGLQLTQRFEVVALSDEAFFAAHDAADAAPSDDELDVTLREFSGLGSQAAGLAPPSNAVRDEQVLAFYDFKTHRLFVREKPPPLVATADPQVTVFAMGHEVGHVLQDQLGAFARTPATFEEAVTRRAVLEGDASLTATLLDGKRRALPAAMAVERVRLALSTLTPRQLAEAEGLSPALLDAPPSVRELVVFPYVHGQRFVFDLFQAGGEALVRAAVLEPPVRSDAVHAPQRWLDGSPRLEPVGTTPRRLGLFLTRLLLAQCEARNPKAAHLGRWVEAHYVDDSFHRAGSMLSWATTWDTAPHPVDVALAREAGVKELDAQSLTWSNERLRAVVPGAVLGCLGASSRDLDVRVSGEVVGAVLHAPSADRERVVGRVSRTALTRDAPRGSARIVPPLAERAYRQLAKGTLRGARWTHEALGLSLDLEGGVVADVPRAVLAVGGRGALLVLSFIDGAAKPEEIAEQVNGRLGAMMAMVNPEAQLDPDTRHVWTPRPGLPGALETRGEFDGPVALHAVQVPRAEGTVLIITTAQHASGQALIDKWLTSFSLRSGAGVRGRTSSE